MNPVTPGRSSLSSGGFSVHSILYIISKQTLCLSSSLKLRKGEKTKIKDYYLVILFIATQRRSAQILPTSAFI